MTRHQIGKSGELLVQYKLLLHGIESAPMTTDTGVDLVAFSNRNNKVITVQVKTNLKPKPAGGKGKKILDWWVADNSPADVIASVDLSTSTVWLFKAMEVAKYAQQHPKDRYHFGMYVDPSTQARKDRKAFVYEFQDFLIERRMSQIF